jgi:hypothetical protein
MGVRRIEHRIVGIVARIGSCTRHLWQSARDVEETEGSARMGPSYLSIYVWSVTRAQGRRIPRGKKKRKKEKRRKTVASKVMEGDD